MLVVIHTPALEVLLLERADKPGYWQSVTGSLDAHVAAGQPASEDPPPPRTAEEFTARYKDWVDEQNERFQRIGIWNEEFRTW